MHVTHVITRIYVVLIKRPKIKAKLVNLVKLKVLFVQVDRYVCNSKQFSNAIVEAMRSLPIILLPLELPDNHTLRISKGKMKILAGNRECQIRSEKENHFQSN